MNDLSELIVGLVALNGGRLVGKTRLQKTFFLLEGCGLGSGVDFDYHHFGPFSAEVAIAADDAVAAGRLNVEERPGHHEVPYSLYSTDERPPEMIGALIAADAAQKLEIMSGYSALELEVATTILYLRDSGYGDDAVERTQDLKPLKANSQRVKKALRLIGDLGL